MICFHNIGGNATLYNRLQKELKTAHVCAIELPGRTTRKKEECYADWEKMADAAADAVYQCVPTSFLPRKPAF